MVVVVSARVRGLVARGAVDIDAVHELEPGEDVERPVDRGEPDRPVRLAQPVVDGLGRQDAALAREQGEDLAAGAARAVPGPGELALGVLGPVRPGRVRHAPSIAPAANENQFQYGPSVVVAVLLRCLLLALALVPAAGARGRVEVVASTTQLADLARNVAGSRAEVRGLLHANADPHDYELRPSDLDGLAGAAVVLRSGGDLDAWLQEGIESAGGDPDVVSLLDAVRAEPGPGGRPDPHWWQDPRNAIRAVARIRDALEAADPGGAAAYRANASRYTAALRRLDGEVAACVRQVPAAQRKLVTTHDALGYYARRYGLEVVGAVIPSLSTRGQPSAGETAALVDLIRAQGVKAIFAESSVNPRVEQAVSRESGARIGRALYADTLGPAGSGADTYVTSIAANTRAIVDGLTGGTRRCALPGT